MPVTQDQASRIAAEHTAAWNSGSPEAVAFFADVPDLSLTCDGIRVAGDYVAYLWTFIGHHSGTRAPLRIAGWEEWDFDTDNNISASRGWYDAADYARQVTEG